MARPNKSGLEYFPFDVDFFEDAKLDAIGGEFGLKGEIATVKLLCAVYKNGYFVVWNDLLKMQLLKKLPGVSPDLLEQIVQRLVTWGFFDKSLYNSDRVLTSNGIQKRYFEATKRRSSKQDYVFAIKNDVNVRNNPNSTGIIVDKNTTKKKESKEKENNNSNNTSEEVSGEDFSDNPIEEKIDDVVDDLLSGSAEDSLSIDQRMKDFRIKRFREFGNKMWDDQLLIDEMCMKYRFDIEQFRFFLKEFIPEKILDEKISDTIGEARGHFMNWLRKKFEYGEGTAKTSVGVIPSHLRMQKI